MQVNQTDPGSFLRLLDKRLVGDDGAAAPLGLLVVHLENFDRLVSAFGYKMGQRLIGAFAEQLREHVRAQDKIVRISDSKFAIIVSSLRNPGILVLAANKIGKICAKPIPIGSNELTANLRIGMAAAPAHGSDAETLLQNAETALLAAVSDEADYSIFEPDQLRRVTDSLRLEVELDLAIKRKEFELYFQPKISTRDFRPCGAEALIRWNNPDRGFVSPEVFIPLADRSGRIEPLTSYVLNAALKQAAEWPEPLSVSVNVSAKMLQSPDLADMVEVALKLWNFEPARLVIEITEGALMSNPETSFEILTDIRKLGVKISIDDFGTGYSSFAYFKNIPADELKIDKSFVMNMFDDAGDKKIVRAIIQLSKEFGLDVTAEGIEDQRTAQILAELECDRLQGYHYSRPIPQQDFIAWLSHYSAEKLVSA